MDYYLNPNNTYDRLREEYIQYGRLIIAVDFDDTLYDYHKKGRTYEDVINLLRRWERHAEIIIVSCMEPKDTERLQFTKNYLTTNNIPFDKINEQPTFSPTPNATKIYYNVLLDDRAGLQEVFEMLTRLIEEIEQG